MDIEGLYNFRDTGGMARATGGAIRSGVLFRSDALTAVTDVGLDQLAATEIGVVVDLRTPAERQIGPDLLPGSRPFHIIELSILEGAMADLAGQFMRGGIGSASPELIARATATLPSLSEVYLGMLQHGAAAFAQVARLIAGSSADEPTAVLVHCTAGKDRTGVAVAIMLDAAGADRDAIIDDYAESENNLAGPWAESMLRLITSMGLPLTPELRELVTGAPPEAIASALDWIDTHFGSAAGYLQSGGLTTDELVAMRARLTA